MKADLTERLIALAVTARQLASKATARILASTATASVLGVGSVRASAITASVHAVVLAAKAQLGKYIVFLQFADSLSVSDVVTFILNRKIEDSTTVSDTHIKAFRKGASDATSVSDLVAKSFRKRLDDSDYAEPGYFLEDYVSHGEDIVTVSDIALLHPVKGLSDTVQFSESVTRQFHKVLNDTVGVTDDLDGMVTVDDDQTMRFFKVLNDGVGVTDEFVRTVGYNRTFDDGAGVTDTLAKNCGKALADPVFASDVTALLVTKPFAEVMSISDNAIKTTTKAATDTVRATDSGYLRNQGYVDFSYLAEDYVGDSRTF